MMSPCHCVVDVVVSLGNWEEVTGEVGAEREEREAKVYFPFYIEVILATFN